MKKTEKTCLILTMTSIFCLIDGVLCFFLKSITADFIDSNGILHENFFFIPVGYGLIFVAIILSIISIVLSKKEKQVKS